MTNKSIAIKLSLLALIVANSALAKDRVVECDNCSITAISVNPFPSVATLDPQVQFPIQCVGTITTTDNSDLLKITSVLDIFAENNSCPLEVSVNNQVANTLHANNGNVIFSGSAPGGLSIIADNGVAYARDGGDDSLTIQSVNGGTTIERMGGQIRFTTINGPTLIKQLYGYTLEGHSINGGIDINGLTLYGNGRTAYLLSENGSISIRRLSGRILSKDQTKYIPAKVRVIGRSINGRVRDRRPLKKRPLTTYERKHAAILRLRTVNGDITVR